jgi:protein-S-isoprenylcysteine O-methyltransferase Ste14
MTDSEVAERKPSESAVNPWSDWAARAVIVVIFTALAFLNLVGIPRQLPLNSIQKVLTVLACLANVMFLSLIASTAITRLAPIGKAKGIEPRISALLGTFLATGLASLPKTELGPVLSATSTILILIGASLSFVVLRWLGKSFSIMAEARRLVTEGPYRIVRHPLYICEGIAAVGVLLQVFSPLAVLVALAFGLVQYRRMINEEEILSSTFPEYRAYAANTPRVISVRVAGPFSDSNGLPETSKGE